MKRIILSAVLAAAMALGAGAEIRSVTVKYKNGGPTYTFGLNENVNMDFRNGAIEMSESKSGTDHVASYSFPVKALESINFTNAPGDDFYILSGIDDATAAPDLTIGFDGREITVVAPDDVAIEAVIVDIHGRTVARASRRDGGSITIAVVTLTRGTYILRANNQTLKFAVR